MRPIFTIHAGEYLVANHIEAIFPKLKVWVPSKDKGIDLLVTNASHKKVVGLQVKFSKDFSTIQAPELQRGLQACGWWSLERKKIENSPADIWVLVVPSFFKKEMSFLVIRPGDLLKRYRKIHGSPKRFQSYFRVTESGLCWETRGLSRKEMVLVAGDAFKSPDRDFSQYLNDWALLKRALV